VLPTRAVPTRDLLQEAHFDRLGYPLDAVEQLMGISHTRHAPSGTKPGDLAIDAARIALQRSGIPAHKIGAAFYCGIDRDYVEPATMHRVAHAVGIKPGLCWDISDACHGLITGLLTAQALIAAGTIEYALLCTGEVPSLKTQMLVDLFKSGKLGRDSVEKSIGGMTVSDVGGAMVVGVSEDASGIIGYQTRCDSSQSKLCFADFTNVPYGGEPEFAMEMGKICAKTIGLVRKMVPESLQRFGWQRDEIDFLIPHQVGERPFLKYLDIFGLKPEQSIATFPTLGNLTTATFPVCWDKLSESGQLQALNKIFCVFTGSGIASTHLGISLKVR
jgi:3-oxoacyl-[acyl-carrier-protein] synthase-3